MASNRPAYVIRRVRIIHEEYQVIKTNGNNLGYVDPEKGNGEYLKRYSTTKDRVDVVEPARILTEAEAAMFGIEYEGERITVGEVDAG